MPAWLPALLLPASWVGSPGRRLRKRELGGVLLGPDPERPGWLATAGDLEPLPGLAGRRLPVAVLTLVLALAAEQTEAAEGVAVQPDGRPEIRHGVGIVGYGLLGQLHVGEADHWMRPLAVWPGQDQLAGESDELALVMVLAAPGGVLDPADMGEGMDALMQHGLQGPAGGLRPGNRRRRTARAAAGPLRDPMRHLGRLR
jgi:hypothetical protein